MEICPGGGFIAGLTLGVGAAMMWRERTFGSMTKHFLFFLEGDHLANRREGSGV